MDGISIGRRTARRRRADPRLGGRGLARSPTRRCVRAGARGGAAMRARLSRLRRRRRRRPARRHVARRDGGSGRCRRQASVVAHAARLPALAAALVNGAAGHALDFDDVNIAFARASVGRGVAGAAGARRAQAKLRARGADRVCRRLRDRLSARRGAQPRPLRAGLPLDRDDRQLWRRRGLRPADRPRRRRDRDRPRHCRDPERPGSSRSSAARCASRSTPARRRRTGCSRRGLAARGFSSRPDLALNACKGLRRRTAPTSRPRRRSPHRPAAFMSGPTSSNTTRPAISRTRRSNAPAFCAAATR